MGGTGGTGETGGTGGTGETGGTGGTGQTGGTGGGGPPPCVPVGHDEDGDAIDDACDNCPSFGNAGQEDADGDGLGDVCEREGDAEMLSRVLHFESFAFDGWEPGWDLEPEYDGGVDLLQAKDESCPGGCGADALWKQPVNSTSYSVEASLVYEPYSWGYAGVTFAHGTSASSWWACLLNRGTSRTLGLWHYPGTGTAVEPMAQATGVEPTSTDAEVLRWVRAYRDGDRITCEFRNSEGALARTQPFQAQGPLTGRAGVRVYSANVDFRSFTVYE
jgi:hypothetical protein